MSLRAWSHQVAPSAAEDILRAAIGDLGSLLDDEVVIARLVARAGGDAALLDEAVELLEARVGSTRSLLIALDRCRQARARCAY